MYWNTPFLYSLQKWWHTLSSFGCHTTLPSIVSHTVNNLNVLTPAHIAFFSNIWKIYQRAKSGFNGYTVWCWRHNRWQHDNVTWSNCHKVFNSHTYSGGVFTGVISDFLDARATSSVIMMYLAVPAVRETPLVHIHTVQVCFLKHRGICLEINFSFITKWCNVWLT